MKTEAPKSFTIDDNMLVMIVEGKGISYRQRCSKETYNAVVEAFEDFRQHSIEAIANDLDLPWTQTAVAVAFLKEKSLLEIKNRRNKAVCQEIYNQPFTLTTCGHSFCTRNQRWLFL